MRKVAPAATAMPAACARRTNGTIPGSCGWAAAVARSASGSASTIDISQAISRRDPIAPAAYSLSASSQMAGACLAMT